MKPLIIEKTLADVTGIASMAQLTLQAYDWQGQTPINVPKLDSMYRYWDEESVEVFNGWTLLSRGDGMYFWGPTGAGKSSFVRQWCARIGQPLEEVNGHRRMMLNDHVGQFVVLKDGMVYAHGPLARALKYGSWFLLNEMDQLDPSVLIALNTVLDGQAMVITENGGEIIKPHPNFRFIATGNTAGGGDTNGSYPGAQRQNMAFMDRFWVLEVGYPPEDIELEVLLRTVPEVPEQIAIKLIKVANQVRTVYTGGTVDSVTPNSIDVTFSTRSLIRWATNVAAFSVAGEDNLTVVKRGLSVSLLNRANIDTRQAIIGLFDREFGHAAPLAA